MFDRFRSGEALGFRRFIADFVAAGMAQYPLRKFLDVRQPFHVVGRQR
jgi:hypothetical protein